MGRVLCIANQKGGVGKTTVALNLADTIAKAGYRSLLVDLDPQCNATGGLGLQPVGRHPLVSDAGLETGVLKTTNELLDLLPGSRSFHDVDQLASPGTRASERMVERLGESGDQYEYVLLDCPPSLGHLTRAALAASHEVLMPIQCEYFAMEGLTQMIEVIRDVMRQPGRNLQFGGIVLTMYDPALELTLEVDEDVREFFGDIVFQTVIPRDVTVPESVSHGLSVLDHAPRSRATRAFIELCMEVLDRE